MIGDLANMIRDRADKKGLHFEVDVNRKTPHILYGDEILSFFLNDCYAFLEQGVFETFIQNLREKVLHGLQKKFCTFFVAPSTPDPNGRVKLIFNPR